MAKCTQPWPIFAWREGRCLFQPGKMTTLSPLTLMPLLCSKTRHANADGEGDRVRQRHSRYRPDGRGDGSIARRARYACRAVFSADLEIGKSAGEGMDGSPSRAMQCRLLGMVYEEERVDREREIRNLEPKREGKVGERERGRTAAASSDEGTDVRLPPPPSATASLPTSRLRRRHILPFTHQSSGQVPHDTARWDRKCPQGQLMPCTVCVPGLLSS